MRTHKTPRSLDAEQGFSLIEAMVAAGLLAASFVALVQLFAIAVRSNVEARSVTYATVLAQQKLEQLQALTWGYNAQGLPVSDTTTDTAVNPERPAGGTGLSRSPSTSLRENTPGFVDYIDQFGRSLGGGADAPGGAVYVRRWAIQPLPADPENALSMEVLVTRATASTAARQGGGTPLADARVMTVKSRSRW